MKTILFAAVLFVVSTVSAQKFSKVKIYADRDGLVQLFNEGIPVDHGYRKSGQFIITDLSEQDIQRVAALNYQYEVVIDDVKKYYVQQNSYPAQPKNASCSGTSTRCSSASATGPNWPSWRRRSMRAFPEKVRLHHISHIFPAVLAGGTGR